MAKPDTTKPTTELAAEIKPAVAADIVDPTKRAVDPTLFAGRADNNGALMGVAGAKYVERKPAQEFDERGILVVKLDANGNVIKKPDGLAGITGVPGGSEKSGAGDSYKAMARKLEAQREAQRVEAEKHEAMLLKTQIVEEIRKGNGTPDLHDQLERINRRVFNLPADHTGY